MAGDGRTKRDDKTDDNDRRDVTIYLPVSLHRKLKVYAAQNDRSVSSVVEEMLDAFLNARITEH